MRHGLVALLMIVASAAVADTAEPAMPPLGAPPPGPRDETDKLVQVALKRLKADGMSGVIEFAFDEKTGRPPAADKRAELEANFLRLRGAQVQRLGKSVGDPELLRAETSGRSLVRYLYAEPMERGPIIWQFSFYRSEAGEWQCFSFQTQDGTETEFRPLAADADFKDAKQVAQAGADALKADGVAGLFDVVFADGKNVIPAERGPAEKFFTKLRADAAAALGKSLGEIEPVRTETVGKSLVRFVYLDKYERGVAVWKFTLYRVGGEWKWRDVNVTGDLANGFPATP